MEPITENMKKEVHLQMKRYLQSVHQTTYNLKEQLENMKEAINDLGRS